METKNNHLLATIGIEELAEVTGFTVLYIRNLRCRMEHAKADPDSSRFHSWRNHQGGVMLSPSGGSSRRGRRSPHKQSSRANAPGKRAFHCDLRGDLRGERYLA